MKELNETILSLLAEYVEDGTFYLTTQSFSYIKEDIVESYIDCPSINISPETLS